MDESNELDEAEEGGYSRTAVFAHEILLKPVNDRPLYYTGFKVPDDFSIPLVDIIKKNLIPGLTEASLTSGGIRKLAEPLPPYKQMKIMIQGKVLGDIEHLF